MRADGSTPSLATISSGVYSRQVGVNSTPAAQKWGDVGGVKNAEPIKVADIIANTMDAALGNDFA